MQPFCLCGLKGFFVVRLPAKGEEVKSNFNFKYRTIKRNQLREERHIALSGFFLCGGTLLCL